MDSPIFLAFTHRFLQHTEHLRRNGRKVLLVYDGYRSHLSLPVLELFAKNNVIVYSLPSHSSGKLQPLDFVLFGVFKNALRSITVEVFAANDGVPLNQRDFCSILRAAYKRSFTKSNFKSAFRRVALWPVDASLFTSSRVPEDNTPGAPFATVEELEAAVQQMRVQMRDEVLGARAEMTQSGFLDNTRGGVMNVGEAFEKVQEKARLDSAKALQKERERVQKELRAARAAAKSAS